MPKGLVITLTGSTKVILAATAHERIGAGLRHVLHGLLAARRLAFPRVQHDARKPVPDRGCDRLEIRLEAVVALNLLHRSQPR